jgi:tRNA pseudouridine55 synthase
MTSGVLNIYKPAGPTSHDIVDEIRRITGIKRVGHAGTLDPFAEGVLIILIDKTTKLQSKFMAMPKTYVATLRLGAVSDTYDITGIKSQITSTESQTISKSQIQEILNSFIGEIEQAPPAFSAIKIKGKKAYELARKGIKPELKPRKVKIYDIKLLNYKYPRLKIEVKCSKGTYIRSLANDIGEKLSCGAYLEKLIRTQIGKFNIDNSVRIDKLNKNNWQTYLICVL